MSAIDRERRALERLERQGDHWASLKLALLRTRIGGEGIYRLGYTSTHVVFLLGDTIVHYCLESRRRAVHFTNAIRRELVRVTGRIELMNAGRGGSYARAKGVGKGVVGAPAEAPTDLFLWKAAP